MDEKRQVQKELFEEFGSPEKRRYPKNLFENKSNRTITLLYEHIAFIIIGIIVLSIIVFSLGVERGKSVRLKRVSLAAENKKDIDNIVLSKADKDAEVAVIEEEKALLPLPEYEEEPLPAYTVQVASYASESFAKGRVDKLISEGYEAFALHKGSYYIMCIGRFRDKEDAVSEMKRLRKQYSDCLLRKI
ncbi:MAG: SPOR domain-containing protein [Candidatus Orphnella occulta]|nr:SPOR domain-containing protein [Candidatus Orphnella occulta]MDP8298076.1 SPOR domain-containing protein [Candidatus Orphnella occulta]